MKTLLFIVLFTSSFLFRAQNHELKKTVQKPQTELKKNQAQASSEKKYSSNSTYAFNGTKHDTCLDKQFSIVFYVVLDSNGTALPANTPSLGYGYATPAMLASLIDQLNKVFKPICVSFKNCSTVYIPFFTYGRAWRKGIHEPIVTGGWYTEKTINFYLVDTVAFTIGSGAEAEGDTYEPIPANLPPQSLKRDIIVLDKYKLLQINHGVSMHLMGHFFGLKHTHDEISPTPPAVPGPPSSVTSQEFADGSNCYTHGDGLCDTEADPGNDLIHKDGMGKYYIHPKDNFMSYYSQRCRFTQEQYNKMVHTILTKRLYLH